jgi:hypothetical protein
VFAAGDRYRHGLDEVAMTCKYCGTDHRVSSCEASEVAGPLEAKLEAVREAAWSAKPYDLRIDDIQELFE